MTESPTRYSPELVPDVLLHLFEAFRASGNLQNILNFRLISKTWNATLETAVQRKAVCNLTPNNFEEFAEFISSEDSIDLGYSNIRSVILNFGPDYETTLQKFVQLPDFFLSNLESLEFNFHGSKTPSFDRFFQFLIQLGPIEFLDNLTLKADYMFPKFDPTSRNTTSVFPFLREAVTAWTGGIGFPNLTRLIVPFHVSAYMLNLCSGLTHLTLLAYEIAIGSDFWDLFKQAVAENEHHQTLRELFIVNKLQTEPGFNVGFSLHQIWECQFTLRKLGLELPYEKQEECLMKLLHQQSETLEYLQIPRRTAYSFHDQGSTKQAHFLFLRDRLQFPRLQELHYGAFNSYSSLILANCPNLTSAGLVVESGYKRPQDYVQDCPINNIQEVTIHRGMRRDLSRQIFQMFPGMIKLKISDEIHDPRILSDIFRNGKPLKALSIKFQFNTRDERALAQGQLKGEPGFPAYTTPGNVRRRYVIDSPIPADCFLVGLKPRYCKLYHTGEEECYSTTEFRKLSLRRPSLPDLSNLESLTLEGNFTELTVWAGIKKLTQLQELHLKSQRLLHPTTLMELERHLPELKSWSFMKLTEEKHGMKELYKYFRILPNNYNSTQLQFWKYSVDKVEKSIVRISEFDAFNETGNGEEQWIPPRGYDEGGMDLQDIDDPSSEDEDENNQGQM